jgi:SAM-dependent methyltransferase
MAALTAVMVAAWPLASSLAGPAWSPIVAGACGTALALLYFGLGSRPRPLAASVLFLMLIAPGLDYFHLNQTLLFKDRNFYGLYRVVEKDGKRLLWHGATVHGGQYLDPARQGEALFYYHQSAPAGELLSSGLFTFRDLGIVGLGTGSLAVYAAPGAAVDFYELDPEIKTIADRYFTYLAHSRGRLRFFFGDARRSLLQAPDRRYDLLILDAFDSDAIPVHLLTMEAIEEDLQHLKPGGFILVHISNRHLDFRPVLTATARALHLSVLYKSNEGLALPDADVSEWMAIGPDRGTAAQLASRLHWEDLSTGAGVPRVRPWTDQFSDLLSPLLAKNGF